MRPASNMTAQLHASAIGGKACFDVPMWGRCEFDQSTPLLNLLESRVLAAGRQISADRFYNRSHHTNQTSQ